MDINRPGALVLKMPNSPGATGNDFTYSNMDANMGDFKGRTSKAAVDKKYEKQGASAPTRSKRVNQSSGAGDGGRGNKYSRLNQEPENTDQDVFIEGEYCFLNTEKGCFWDGRS